MQTTEVRKNRQRGGARSRIVIGWVIIWLAWALPTMGYSVLRDFGDEIFTPNSVSAIEESLFFGSPPHALQDWLDPDANRWLAYMTYLAHGFWFGLPFGFGIVLMIFGRQKLAEMLWWTVVVSYVSVAVFLVFPVKPPWMEGGLTRVLVESGITDYTGLDNNPAAAFPSLHAALPMTMALFFFLRGGERLRFCAWLLLASAIVIGFSVVYLGEHWLIDVLAGYTVAGLTAVLCAHPRLLAAYNRLPGRPIDACRRWNRWLCALPPEEAVEPGDESPETLPKAA